MANFKFYFDEMMPRPAADELSKRGHQVVMANDVGMTGRSDPEHLQYAAQQDLVMVTFDQPFAGSMIGSTNHAGLVCLTIERPDQIGRIVRLLEEFANQHMPDAVTGQVFWLK